MLACFLPSVFWGFGFAVPSCGEWREPEKGNDTPHIATTIATAALRTSNYASPSTHKAPDSRASHVQRPPRKPVLRTIDCRDSFIQIALRSQPSTAFYSYSIFHHHTQTKDGRTHSTTKDGHSTPLPEPLHDGVLLGIKQPVLTRPLCTRQSASHAVGEQESRPGSPEAATAAQSGVMTRPGTDPAAVATNTFVTIPPGSPLQRQSSGSSLGRDHGANSSEDDENLAKLIGSLWDHAPFPRLPADAPPELRELVYQIEDPRRVYAVHRAARRHGCQALIQKFIVQLRDGCGTKTCLTPTCFSYRKRAARVAPIRRYNTTSARVLAVYMVGADNPESHLCPNLGSPKGPPTAMQSLKFSPLVGEHRAPLGSAKRIGADIHSTRPAKKGVGLSPSAPSHAHGERLLLSPSRVHGNHSGHVEREDEGEAKSTGPGFKVEEEPVGKDRRSFVANVFDTVAFKMVEWLSRSGVEHMDKQASAATASKLTSASLASPAATDNDKSQADNTLTHGQSDPGQPGPSQPDTLGQSDRLDTETHDAGEKPPDSTAKAPTDQGDGLGSKTGTEKRHPKVGPSRRNSNAKVRTSSVSKAHRQMSLEPFPPPIDDPSSTTKPTLMSPNAVPSDKVRQPRTGPVAGRLVTETVAFEVLLQDAQQHEPAPKRKTGHVDGDDSGEHQEEVVPERRPIAAAHRAGKVLKQQQQHQQHHEPQEPQEPQEPLQEQSKLESLLEPDAVLPQSLSHLSVDVVEFLCNVLHEDGTSDGPLFDPYFAERLPSLKKPDSVLKRSELPSPPEPARLTTEWKLFVEQSIFSTLSDPHALVRSFTENGALIDSAMLWYCMLRLTRTAPALVFDSLWLAAASLFSPPQSLRAPRQSQRRLGRSSRPLSNADAAHLMSICLHALAAAVPLSDDVGAIRAISESRSNGIAVPFEKFRSPQVHDLALQYYDVFSNHLTLRLAKRLFSALTVRRYYAELVDHDDDIKDTAVDLDLLRPLITQLENSDFSASFPEGVRSVYETRVSALILNWATAVAVDQWDGQPEFSSDGPFGGALSLMSAMYKQRKPLMVGEHLFRMDYFANRLDPMALPHAWLSCTPTPRRHHLLEYPFLFTPSSLVNYFRSINISRMGKHHLDADTVMARTGGLDPERDIMQSRHERFIVSLLRPATNRFLILDIVRDKILECAFDQLWRRELRELLLPIKVLFSEEDGIDQGGVQMEFFRLAISQCLDPQYGAFSLDDRTRMSWFVPGSVVDPWRFEMIGLIVSLAVYNGLTLPVTFPKALYRKILGHPVRDIHHIEDGWPELSAGLNSLLDWDESYGLVEDVFARTYEFSVEAFGQRISREMSSIDDFADWPSAVDTSPYRDAPLASDQNPADARMVTSANREAYVTDYIHWLTDVSIKPQFEAFERGFRAVLHPKAISLLSPALLQTVVEGVQEIDIAELRRHTTYEAWPPGAKCIDYFWDVVGEYDDEMKRKLLEFVTASSRVPIGGMANIMFKIQMNGMQGPESDLLLPTSHTCFGTLLLPDYSSRECLAEKLAIALDNTEGFALR